MLHKKIKGPPRCQAGGWPCHHPFGRCLKPKIQTNYHMSHPCLNWMKLYSCIKIWEPCPRSIFESHGLMFLFEGAHHKCSQSNVSIFGIMKRFLVLNTIGLHKIKEIYVRLWWMMIVVIVNVCVLQNLAWFISSELQGHRFQRFIVIWPTYSIIFRISKNRAVFITIFSQI